MTILRVLRYSIFISLTSAAALVMSSPARASVDIGISIGDEGIRDFYLSIGDYYHVPEREVIIIRERNIPDEEIPVVFFLAKRARVSPAGIVDLRLRGMTWMDITLHYHLTPEIFYVPVKVRPPYGKAYGHYLNKPRKKWKRIVLRDDDVVDLVNLKFISEHYRYPAAEVMKKRFDGWNFVMIHDDVRKMKKERREFREHKERREKIMKKKGREKEKHKGRGKDD